MTAQTLKDAAEIRQFVADRLGCGTDLTDAFYAGAYGALTNANPRFVSAVRPMADRSADAGKGHADAAHAVYVDGLGERLADAVSDPRPAERYAGPQRLVQSASGRCRD
jgi:hypothetical protein